MTKKTTTPKKKTSKKPARKTAKRTPATTEESTAHDILTIDQAAEYLQLSRATIYRLIKNGEIPVKRIGERYRFSRRKLLGWIEGK